MNKNLWHFSVFFTKGFLSGNWKFLLCVPCLVTGEHRGHSLLLSGCPGGSACSALLWRRPVDLLGPGPAGWPG